MEVAAMPALMMSKVKPHDDDFFSMLTVAMQPSKVELG